MADENVTKEGPEATKEAKATSDGGAGEAVSIVVEALHAYASEVVQDARGAAQRLQGALTGLRQQSE